MAEPTAAELEAQIKHDHELLEQLEHPPAAHARAHTAPVVAPEPVATPAPRASLPLPRRPHRPLLRLLRGHKGGHHQRMAISGSAIRLATSARSSIKVDGVYRSTSRRRSASRAMRFSARRCRFQNDRFVQRRCRHHSPARVRTPFLIVAMAAN